MSAEYPHLKQFVKDIILPEKLKNNTEILDAYTKLLLDNLNQTAYAYKLYSVRWFREIIAESSPCPGWLDPSWGMTFEQISKDVIDELKTALANDGIEYRKNR